MNPESKKIPWIPIIVSIFYFALVGIAIYLNVKMKSDYAFKSSTTLAVFATVAAIIILFTLEKDINGDKQKQKTAGLIFMHLILWGAILFLPFGDYPKISLAAIILFALNEAGLTASLSSEEKNKKSTEGMKTVAENAARAAFFLILLIIVLHLGKSFGFEHKVKNFFGDFKSEMKENQKSENGETFDNGGYYYEDDRQGNLIATVKGYISPFDFKTNTPFLSTAEGEINPNITSDAAVNVTIYFKNSGDIILDNGTVQKVNKEGCVITGTWNQPKSGLSGTYYMDVIFAPEKFGQKTAHENDDSGSAFAIVDLEYGGQNITTIELVSN